MSTSPAFCETGLIFKNDLQKCDTPYSLTIKLDKSIYSVSDHITGSIQLSNTNQLSQAYTIKLKDKLGNQIGSTLSGQTSSSGTQNFDLGTGLQIGDYVVNAALSSYSNSPATADVSVRNPIFVRIVADPDKIQYSGATVNAKAFVTGLGGTPTTAANWDFTGTKCDNQDYSNKISVSLISTADGTYELSAPVSAPCTFIYQVKAVDGSGLKSDSAIETITVRSATVAITPDLSGIINKDAGTFTVKFTTFDANLQPLDTNNFINITLANGCSSGQYCAGTQTYLDPVQVSPGSPGFYEFTYNYPAGLNLITITSVSKANSNIKNTQTYNVNLFPSSTGGGGNPPPTGTSTGSSGIIIIVVIIVFIVIIGGFFYFILRRPKKKVVIQQPQVTQT